MAIAAPCLMNVMKTHSQQVQIVGLRNAKLMAKPELPTAPQLLTALLQSPVMPDIQEPLLTILALAAKQR
jgi:hypothetical protein